MIVTDISENHIGEISSYLKTGGFIDFDLTSDEELRTAILSCFQASESFPGKKVFLVFRDDLMLKRALRIRESDILGTHKKAGFVDHGDVDTIPFKTSYDVCELFLKQELSTESLSITMENSIFFLFNPVQTLLHEAMEPVFISSTRAGRNSSEETLIPEMRNCIDAILRMKQKESENSKRLDLENLLEDPTFQNFDQDITRYAHIAIHEYARGRDYIIAEEGTRKKIAPAFKGQETRSRRLPYLVELALSILEDVEVPHMPVTLGFCRMTWILKNAFLFSGIGKITKAEYGTISSLFGLSPTRYSSISNSAVDEKQRSLTEARDIDDLAKSALLTMQYDEPIEKTWRLYRSWKENLIEQANPVPLDDPLDLLEHLAIYPRNKAEIRYLTMVSAILFGQHIETSLHCRRHVWMRAYARKSPLIENRLLVFRSYEEFCKEVLKSQLSSDFVISTSNINISTENDKLGTPTVNTTMLEISHIMG